MAYKSKYTGAQIDDAIGKVNDPRTLVTDDMVAKVLEKITGQQIVDKINTISGEIVFTKYIDAQGGAGNSKA